MSVRRRPALTTRLGRRFLIASAGVLAVALGLIVIAAQAMFISAYDLRLLMWVLVPAVLAAGVVALSIARPIAEDANRLSETAHRVAAGDLSARTGVRRDDELGEAAARFDQMVDRLEAVERERVLLVSSISHDLRTPLAALQALLEALSDDLVDDVSTALGTMERQVAALGALVDDLGLHARVASGSLQLDLRRSDVTEIVDEALEVLGPLAARHQVTLALVATERVWARVDADQLARVVRNLVENAVRHAPSGTTVTVDVGAAPEQVWFRVVDLGPGFPAGAVDEVFEPFTRLDPARRPGSGVAGLGLTIAQGIVRAHGGTIAITPGPGGRVEVTLPGVVTAERRASTSAS